MLVLSWTCILIDVSLHIDVNGNVGTILISTTLLRLVYAVFVSDAHWPGPTYVLFLELQTGATLCSLLAELFRIISNPLCNCYQLYTELSWVTLNINIPDIKLPNEDVLVSDSLDSDKDEESIDDLPTPKKKHPARRNGNDHIF